MPLQQRTIHVTPEIWAALKAKANADGLPIGEVIRRILLEWMGRSLVYDYQHRVKD